MKEILIVESPSYKLSLKIYKNVISKIQIWQILYQLNWQNLNSNEHFLYVGYALKQPKTGSFAVTCTQLIY